MTFRDQALREWNFLRPPWKCFKMYRELTPAEQSLVDERAEELEFNALMVETEDSVRKMDC